MNLFLYRLLTRVLWLPVRLYLWLRLTKGKEDSERFRERLGYAGKERPKGNIIWVHAASVGESVSVIPLITRLLAEYPSLHVVLTTGTVTSARMVAGKLPPNCLHQYVPVDNYKAVQRFVRYWHPMLALWVESELWPNLVTQAAACCPLVMVNGRVSQKSVDFWERYPQLRKRVVESFTLCMVQSEADKARMLHMGAAQVKILGNLKYDAPPLPAAKEAVAQMQEMIAGRPVWIAASTHEGEEEAAAEAHIRLKKRYPQLLTVIVPRHPARLEAITLQLEKKGLKMAIRSKNEPLIADTDIYIADTMGELGLFFRVSKIVFIGASLVPKGGHNPLEPARMGCAIIMGPFVYNCVDICQHLQNKGALIQIENAAKLYDALALLFGDTARQEEMSARALEVVEDTNAITENYITAIKPFLRTIRGVMRA